ncbi:hypothetical protein N8933_04850, partial [Pseudomonadales bacterium]|nr:hypothetical protein [Pseudomonadales bacterium]
MDKIWRQATCTSYHGPIRDRELIQKKRARFSSKPSTMVQWFDRRAHLLDTFDTACVAVASEQLLAGLSQFSS